MTRARAKDDADRAAEEEAAHLAEALWRAKAPTRLQARGKCYNCGDACTGVYCDADCGKDYERRRKFGKDA